MEKINESPIPNVHIKMDEKNFLDWYFVIYGLDDDYEGGTYFGKISFPQEYPFKAPTVKILTPNGRFEADKTICTTFTHYHGETWSPEWNAHGMLLGLISFMYEENERAIGSIKMSKTERQKLAKKSMEFNAKIKKFSELFPELL